MACVKRMHSSDGFGMYALEQKAIWKPRELQFKEKTLRHFILAAFDFVPLKRMVLLLENKFLY